MKLATSLVDRGVTVRLEISDEAVRFFPELQVDAGSASDTGVVPSMVESSRLLEAMQSGLLEVQGSVFESLAVQSCDNLNLSIEETKDKRTKYIDEREG